MEPSVAALRVERARKTLDDYVAATRYPPTSRPISEYPDLLQPLHPVDHAQPIKPGGVARLRVRHDRTFLVGDDAARISIQGEDEAGNPLPCRLLEANATEAPFSPQAGRRGPAALSFTVDGTGALSTIFTPARQGFSEHLGPIRIALRARVADEDGATSFDLYYTPTPPARFTGMVREVLANGSLELFAGIDVRKPGRYLVDGRVADAAGQLFAFVSFNEELPAGRGEVKLVLFGKLVRDRKAASPFVLRDVEGHLLKEDVDPDREILAPLLGAVHTSRAYPESAFSTAEWQSEERSRHVEEFTRNLKELTETAGATGK